MSDVHKVEAVGSVHQVGVTPPAAAALGLAKEAIDACIDIYRDMTDGIEYRCLPGACQIAWQVGKDAFQERQLQEALGWQALAVPVPPPAAPDGVPSTLDRIDPKE
jgi:hypothetical protein